jgi:thioredoxin reductase (NADPH)
MSYDCVIVGAGPAGLSAGLYLAQSKLKILILEGKTPGGQILNTDRVENYLGMGNIEAWKMVDAMVDQVKAYEVDIRYDVVTAVGSSEGLHIARLESGDTLTAKTVILACGGTPRTLSIPGEEEFSMGKGVSYCAVCDGGFFKGKDVAVVGGGDAAATEAQHLAHLVDRVYVIHRRDQWRAKPALVDRMLSFDNITPVMDAVPVEVLGEENVTGVRVENVKTGEKRDLSVQGFFVAIGFIPNSGLFEGAIEKDDEGYIKVDGDMATSVEGVFAVGDVKSHVGRQIAISVGNGASAALSVSRYLAAWKEPPP